MRFFADVRERRRTPEVMDDPEIDAERHASALQGLARVNFWSRSAGALWAAITERGLARRGDSLRILDIASGGGDVPIGLWKRARRAGVVATIVATDVSPVAVQIARQRAYRAGARVEFRLLDAVRDEWPTGFDVVTCSLFLHHLDEPDAREVLRKMADAARRFVVVDDLVRSRAGHLFARIGTQLVSRCDVVHVDGPRSVEGAFDLEEARVLADQSGLMSATIVRRFPWRWLLTWAPS